MHAPVEGSYPCDGPQRHGPVGEDQGQTDGFDKRSLCDTSAWSRRCGEMYLCIRVPGKDEQETVAQLEEVDEDDIDGEPGWVWRDRSWVELNDANCARWSVKNKARKED